MENLKKEALQVIKQNIGAGKYEQAFRHLCMVSQADDHLILQARYVSLFKRIADHVPLKKIRIALLASSTVAHLSDVLKFYLAKEGFAADIYEAPYATIHQTALDAQHPLYAFHSDVVIVFTGYRDVTCDLPAGSSPQQADQAIDAAVKETASLWQVLRRGGCQGHIIQNNADLPYSRVLGNYEATAPWGQTNVLRRFNSELVKAADGGVTIFDLDFLASIYGRARWHEGRFWYHSKHPFALDATGLVAGEMAKTIGALKGGAKKCLVLDLDNTLWGGIIGEDGLGGIALGHGADGEAFVDFQRYILKLKERGILLAVCSKNDESNAKEPFLKHPDMVLKLEDFVVFKANWKNKASNIQQIAAELNIGLDSIIFVDDDPLERDFVKSCLPLVSIPLMPSDPADFIRTMASHSYFETVCFSPEDPQRSAQYQVNRARNECQNQFADITDYLRHLEMKMTVETFDEFHLPRIVQLINKSNQFHLTTTRYTPSQITSIQADPHKVGLYFKLKDRFGDYGLIAAVILERHPDLSMSIDTWVMSCRVLARTVEEFIFHEILETARQQGCRKILGKYVPTSKNHMVAGLYQGLNFKMVKEENGITYWQQDLNASESSRHLLIERTAPAFSNKRTTG